MSLPKKQKYEEVRISVIMGIYNCAPTLAEALDSLLAQTYQGFKVIMCDDGSTDNTVEVAQRYVDHYPDKFILIRNAHNLKLAATLNHCLEYVDTEFTARMDGDDISLPDRFEKEIKFLDEHFEYALVSCPMIYFDEKGDFRIGSAGGQVSRDDFRYGSPFCHAPVMIRTSAYKAVAGYTANKFTERMEDYYLWYKFYKHGYIGYNLNIPLYKMRDDREARNRRLSLINRWFGLHTDIEVLRGLGLSHPYTYPIFHFITGSFAQLLPYSLYKSFRTLFTKYISRN